MNIKSCTNQNGKYYIEPNGAYVCQHGIQHNGNNRLVIRVIDGKVVAHCYSQKCKDRADVILCNAGDENIKLSKIEKIRRIQKDQYMTHDLEPTQNERYLQLDDIELNG